MISLLNIKYPKYLLSLILILPVFVFAGDPIPGIDITVDQSPPGLTQSGVTNPKGEVILSGFKPGPVVVTVTYKDEVAVFGKPGSKRIILPAEAKAPIKPIRLEFARYASGKKGYDHYQSQSIRGPGNSGAEQRANHNTTRANRIAPKAADVNNTSGKLAKRDKDHNVTRSNRTVAKSVTDSTGGSGGTRAQDYNSSRSNTTSAVEVEKEFDKDPVIEITPMRGGRLKVTVLSN